MGKERLDQLLVRKGLFESREKARSAISLGLVKIRGIIEDKPGTKVDEDADLSVEEPLHPYVSRGGMKLQRAIDLFRLDLKDQVVLDIGASTGGFTDCALQQGARLVYAIDVGYGQLAWKLRQDGRVVVMERTNFRYLEPEALQGPPASFAVIDVSFISLRIILEHLLFFLPEGGEVIALVKPQFEAGKGKVGKKGIVRDPHTHRDVLTDILSEVKNLGYTPIGLTYSPIKGGEGNIEFLLYLKKGKAGKEEACFSVEQVVTEAHQVLD